MNNGEKSEKLFNATIRLYLELLEEIEIADRKISQLIETK